mmetsp:Transcript_19899/g.76304  ORF Transcript_19899/g.76304 Transcript_19899/m.76304 type:complete len:263 (+) Transcript_19899:502-1290(+)
MAASAPASALSWSRSASALELAGPSPALLPAARRGRLPLAPAPALPAAAPAAGARPLMSDLASLSASEARSSASVTTAACSSASPRRRLAASARASTSPAAASCASALRAASTALASSSSSRAWEAARSSASASASLAVRWALRSALAASTRDATVTDAASAVAYGAKEAWASRSPAVTPAAAALAVDTGPRSRPWALARIAACWRAARTARTFPASDSGSLSAELAPPADVAEPDVSPSSEPIPTEAAVAARRDTNRRLFA